MSDLVPVVAPSIIDLDCAHYLDFCKQYLYTGTHEVRDMVASSLNDSSTTFAITRGDNAFQPGIRVSCELEDMYVWDIAAKTLTVQRGQFGTIASSHPTSAIIYASPRFSDAEILREINHGIDALSAPGALFAYSTLDITTDGSKRAYDFPVLNALDILSIRVRVPGESRAYKLVNDWYYETNVDDSDFPSTNALFINDPLPTNTTLHVTYSYPFSPLTSLTDLVFPTTNLSTSQYDLPLYYAAIALTAGREIKRNFNETQGETRRAQEVGAGANMASANALRAQYQRRLVEETNKLRKRFPTRKRRVWDLA